MVKFAIKKNKFSAWQSKSSNNCRTGSIEEEGKS